MSTKSRELNSKHAQRLKKNEAVQVILQSDVKFENPRSDVYVAKTPIANATWINTPDGTVLIDTLLTPDNASKMRDKLLETGGPVKTIIYTHHHRDHIGGSAAFSADAPEVIAHRYFPEGIEKYDRLGRHRSRIASIQFNLPFQPDRLRNILPPTRLYDFETTFKLGGKSFELYHARAETDDATWVFIPEDSTAIVGDLIIAGLPNIGNPFKPTRFSMSWVRALELIRDKKPGLLIAHGGRAVYQASDALEVLDVTIEAIHSLQDQVFDAINDNIPVDEMIHQVRLPPQLQNHPYLIPLYSRSEFAVYNIYRWYHGYFDGNPAHLLPRPDKEVNGEIFSLIDDPQKILDRSTELHKRGQTQLALQVLDVLFKQNPDYPGARKLHLELLERLCENDTCLMSRNTLVHFIDQDRQLLSK